MTTTMIEGFSWIVQRRRPDSDIIVSDVAACEDGQVGAELITVLDLTTGRGACHYPTAVKKWVRIVGLHACDYLTSAEASALAGALTAASDELARRG